METISALAKRLVRRVRYEFDQTMAAGPMSLIGCAVTTGAGRR